MQGDERYSFSGFASRYSESEVAALSIRNMARAGRESYHQTDS